MYLDPINSSKHIFNIKEADLVFLLEQDESFVRFAQYALAVNPFKFSLPIATYRDSILQIMQHKINLEEQ